MHMWLLGRLDCIGALAPPQIRSREAALEPWNRLQLLVLKLDRHNRRLVKDRDLAMVMEAFTCDHNRKRRTP